MSNDFQSSKFRFLNDPPVTTRPFSIRVDTDKCIGCGVCIKQCPCQTIEMVPRKAASPLQQASCQYRCPAGTDIRAYLDKLSRGGTLEDAWKIITETNPFPAVTGRVCPHPCETGCNRGGVDDSVNIHGLERAAGDYGIEKGLAFARPEKKRKDKVAIVGAGPSGLSCAYQLSRLGYGVTVFEAEAKPGGMLTWAIPRYRLPEAVVDAEIGRIVDLGVTLKLGVTVGKDVSLDGLKKDHKAVYVALGAQAGTALGIREREGNVHSGLAFLRSVKENKPPVLGRIVVVIGGGNTALDAARTARRLGSDVTILYRRTASEMPAHRGEVDAALAEGVKIDFLCAPVAAGKNGRGRLTCQKMELGPRTRAEGPGRSR
jgi:NADPH-dependent glutamate synthase beta subunit-like oxidoreductase